MNIGKLVILLITIALGALSVPAQQGDGPLTFTDQSNQSITISRFGTVLKFKNSNGKESVPSNVYRVCPCGEKGECMESATLASEKTTSQLEVEFPKKGTTLKKGETLVITATYRQAEITVKRRLNWEAGSSSVKIDDAISGSKPLCLCTFEEPVLLALEMKMCPRPPGSPGYWTCPPSYTSEINPDVLKMMLVLSVLNFSK